MSSPNHNRADLKAMVLAAGLGVRMRPLTDAMPKALVPVAGQPMIHHPLRWLASQGIVEVVINTHHLSELLQKELGDGSRLGLKIQYSTETTLLGTGGGIGRAMKKFGSGRLILINSDTLIDAPLDKVLDRHLADRPLATLVVIPEREPGAFTRVLMDQKHFIRSIGGKPEIDKDAEEKMTPVTYTGLCILEPALIERLPADRPACLMNHALIPALTQGKQISAYLHEGYWNGLDNIERARQAEADLNSGAFRPQFLK